MKKFIFLIYLVVSYSMEGYSQKLLESFIDRQDSIINYYSGDYSDTVVNGMKLKRISEYIPVLNGIPNYYYGKIEVEDGKVMGEQPRIPFSYNDCNPCYIYQFRNDGTLLCEGVKLKGSNSGLCIHYFRNGRVSMISNYIPGKSEESAEQTSIKNGEFIVFNQNGDKLISEFWDRGKIIKIVPYQLDFTGVVRFYADDKMLLINDTISIDYFRKITLRPDTSFSNDLTNGYSVRVKVFQSKLQEDIYSFENIKSFDDSTFVQELKGKKIKTGRPMHMSIDIYEESVDEFIETHFLVFTK